MSTKSVRDVVIPQVQPKSEDHWMAVHEWLVTLGVGIQLPRLC